MIKNYNFFARKNLIICISILFSLLSLSFLLLSNFVSADSSEKVRVVFASPMSFSDFNNMFESYDLNLLELHYTQGDIQGGYTVDTVESIDKVLENFSLKHTEFLSVAIADTTNKIQGTKDTAASDRLNNLLSRLNFAKMETDRNGLEIDRIEISNDNRVIQKLEEDSRVNGIEILEERSEIFDNLTSFVKDIFIDISYASLYHEDWAPAGGGSEVYQSYTYSTFYFNDVSDYGSDDTYEHETQVYDENFADYDNYWSSNMPDAYYDTPFLDDIDNFTVGTFSGDELEDDTEYFTYMSLSAGSSQNATVRIKGQMGHRFPSWCYSTWCVFADATTSSMAIFSAPAGMSWQY
jgi:hypothetical protein